MDILDILIVAFLLYQLLLLIKGTRAVQIIQGVAVLLLALLSAHYFRLSTINWLLHYALMGIAVALPIVFQPELRRALEQLGRGGVISTALSRLGREAITKLVDEIAWALNILAQTKTGALVVLERETGLEEIVETGTKVDGEVSAKLLLSIFMPTSPLHDGAVIIRGNKVMAASCYLPLSDSPWIAKDLGTRHRAAIGISEGTDALAIIVSEETGEISLAQNGKLSQGLESEDLKRMMMSLLSVTSRAPVTPSWVAKLGDKYGRRVPRIPKKKSQS
ncbi:MAG: TIGR00159 family protein [Armatimonadetes bacterium]|nr:TIGR00159 family protein [Armatimonadota bacterium]